jgi:hypothetical protein
MQPQISYLNHFISFAAKELGLSKLPKINFVGKSEDSKRAFGHFFSSPKKTEISIRITDRHPIDIVRTIAHELCHWKQQQQGIHNSEISKEDYANAMAGRIMRKYDTSHPKLFTQRAISHTSLREDGGVGAVTSAIPANAAQGNIGVDSPGYAGYSPKLGSGTEKRSKRRPKKLRKILSGEK